MDNTEPDPLNAPVDPMVAKGLPQHTTPTWEVELLISGIAVFAMLQLPGWLDDRYFEIAPRFDVDWQTLFKIGYIYAKMSTLILAGTFVLHLFLRAHWIALVGMDSVYPNGVRWNRLRIGKYQGEFARRELGSIADAIERADNRATIVFAVGVSMAMLTIKPLILVYLGAALIYGLSFFYPIAHPASLVWPSIGVLLLPMLLAFQFDRYFGERLSPEGLAARTLRAMYTFYSRIGFGRNATPSLLLMSGNTGYRRVVAMTILIVMGALTLAIYQIDFEKNPEQYGNYALFSSAMDGSNDVLRPEHYDDQRDSTRLGTAPFVQSQMIPDAYLRLVIPIDPRQHNEAMRQQCTVAIKESETDGTAQQQRALVDCIGKLHPLTIDDKPVANLHFDLGSDPKARRPALIAMIDVRWLANGRHELLVGEPAQPGHSSSTSVHIPFWR